MPPGTRFTLPNGVHCSPDSGSGEELSFPQSRLPSSALTGLGLAPAGTSSPFPLYRTFSPAPDTFLLLSRASDLHRTFLSCLSTGAITCPFSPLFQRVFFPGQGILDEPPNVLPIVRIPNRERRLLETMQLAIGEFITDSSQPPALTKDVRTKRPRAPVLSGIYWVQLLVGASGLVTQLQGNFCWPNPLWASSFPLIGSLFLARHMLIGWLQVA